MPASWLHSLVEFVVVVFDFVVFEFVGYTHNDDHDHDPGNDDHRHLKGLTFGFQSRPSAVERRLALIVLCSPFAPLWPESFCRVTCRDEDAGQAGGRRTSSSSASSLGLMC